MAFFPHLDRLGYSRAEKGAWCKLRAEFRRQVTQCVFCGKKFEGSEWKVIDHKIPHRGDVKLLLDPRNLQALCAHCHNSKKKLMELHANKPTIGSDGWPVDLK